VHLLDPQVGLGPILVVVNLPLSMGVIVNAVADIPLKIDEAAALDRACAHRILGRIIALLCRPALVTTFVLGFIMAWNEFLFSLMLTTSKAVPMTVGALFFTAGGAGVR
jgi:multiple sugar transport system permease protein